MAKLVGKTLGRYRVVARLGRGGMAEVYKAYQPGLDRYVAIKVLHSHLGEDKDFIGRFEREALAIGKLRHPNIVQALDFDRVGDLYFMTMEYINGPSLKDELRVRREANKPFTLPEIARIFTALCSAINYAHARGMVHRDIKPANVMINEEGQIVLTDFGIARIAGATQYTQTGALTGTPAYMSPEQGQGEHGDERSDIYALGIMLYEMVTGAVPYDADTPFAVIMKHISEPLPLPTQVDPQIPEAVERVILKAMSKTPDDRYQKPSEMAQALREAVGLAPGDTLQNVPLVALASAPKVEQIDHPTGPITRQEVEATKAMLADDGATILSTESSAQTAAGQMAPATTGLPKLPLLIGGGIAILLLLFGAIAAVFTFGRSQATPQPTEDTLAEAAVTQTAEQASLLTTANQAATETAELMVPTLTAEAAVTQEARATAAAQAQATRDAELIAGALSARDATETAIAAARASTAEAATAEFLSSITLTPIPTETTTSAPATDTPTVGPTNTPVPVIPTNTPTPARPAISGKLAFPVDNGSGQYDVFIVSMPAGDQIGRIQGARQPYFRNDGARLLVNGQGGSFGEDVYEADANGNIIRAVSGSPSDSHPTYNPDGNRIAYDNPQLAIGTDGNYHSYIFVQCGIVPPSQESDKCQNIAEFGILVPAGQIGEIQGSNPVWAANDQIFYKGCNSWAGGGSCGIFTVGSWGTKQFSNGETPRKLTDGTSSIPTDTKGNLVAFHSSQSGSWEAYVMDLGGGGIVNISNSPNSNDGLPTISSDGQWVAFASDREGGWAVYVAPSNGGQATKLFDFPKANPWGVDDRAWQNERIAWGP